MKSVLLSIKPQYCALIKSENKTIEVRKTKPKMTAPFKCYIYETKGKSSVPVFVDEEGHISYEIGGKVIGEFVCDEILAFAYNSGGFLVKDDVSTTYSCLAKSCLSHKEFRDYAKDKTVYGWHISELIIYDKPKELSKFYIPCVIYEKGDGCGDIKCPKYETPGYEYGDVYFDCEGKKPISRPPQSWYYAEEVDA